MTASMDWNNMNFKATDVIKLVVGLTSLIAFGSNINNNINNLNDQIREMKEYMKSSEISKGVMQNQINMNTTDIMLLKQRIDAQEKRTNFLK